jgi:hypothetical protein
MKLDTAIAAVATAWPNFSTVGAHLFSVCFSLRSTNSDGFLTSAGAAEQALQAAGAQHKQVGKVARWPVANRMSR